MHQIRPILWTRSEGEYFLVLASSWSVKISWHIEQWVITSFCDYINFQPSSPSVPLIITGNDGNRKTLIFGIKLPIWKLILSFWINKCVHICSVNRTSPCENLILFSSDTKLTLEHLVQNRAQSEETVCWISFSIFLNSGSLAKVLFNSQLHSHTK